MISDPLAPRRSGRPLERTKQSSELHLGRVCEGQQQGAAGQYRHRLCSGECDSFHNLISAPKYFDCRVSNLIFCFQVDGTISHHDMFDYVTLTQKGYTKAFEPVNELLTTLLQEMEGEVRLYTCTQIKTGY